MIIQHTDDPSTERVTVLDVIGLLVVGALLSTIVLSIAWIAFQVVR